MKFIRQLLYTVLISTFVYALYHSFSPSNEAQLDHDHFSLANAKSHVNAIAQEPHYVGSKAHAQVRNYITQQLIAISVDEVHTQQAFSISDRGQVTIPENIVGRLKATHPKPNSKAILLLSHYDSSPHSSFGASDAASGVAIILESLRSYLATEPEFSNDIIICLTDAEELGLNGAELFVREHPWASDIGLVLNFESRGSGGPSNMIVETNAGNAQIISQVKQAGLKHPMANSLMYSVYKLLPNDTDSTIFREKVDIPSLFFAFIDDHFDYHTALDIPSRLNDQSLLHQADYLLRLLPQFANAKLNLLKTSQDHVYVNIANYTIVSYPYSWAWPLVIISFLVWLIAAYVGFQQQNFSLKQLGLSSLAWLSLFIGITAIGYILAQIIASLYPQYNSILQGFPYNGHDYIVVVVSLSLATLFASVRRLIHLFSSAAMYTGFGLVAWLIGVLFFWFLPGANYFMLPILCIQIGMLIYNLNWSHKRLLGVLLGIPALILLTPFVLFFPVGLGLSMLLLSSIFTVFSFGCIQGALTSNFASRLSAYLCLVIAVFFFMKAHLSAEFTPEQPQPNSLNYQVYPQEQQAFWLTYDTELDSYTSNYLTTTDTLTPANNYSSKYNSKATYRSEAPYIFLPQASLSVDTTYVSGDLSYYSLRLKPAKATRRLSLYLPKSINFNSFKLNGLEPGFFEANGKSYHIFKQRYSNRLFDYHVVNQEPLELKFSVQKNVDLNFELHEINYDLHQENRLNIKPRTESQIPKPFIVNDAIIITKKISLNAQ